MPKTTEEVRDKWKCELPQIMVKRLPGIHFMCSPNPLSRLAGLELDEAEKGCHSKCEVDNCSNVGEWNSFGGVWVFYCVGCMKETEEAWIDYEGRPESCSCHTGNPPCSFCTDRNYCDTCDVSTWDEECPECGKGLVDDGSDMPD